MNPPRISLVVATVGRLREPARLVDSLLQQDPAALRSCELIIVDQNPDERLGPIWERIEGYVARVKWMRVAGRGAGWARNQAIPEVQGTHIVFPDDDCWYPGDFLGALQAELTAYGDNVALVWRGMDPELQRKPIPYPPLDLWVGRNYGALLALGWTMSVPSEAFRRIGGFDTRFGPGARWGAFEEPDVIVRMSDLGTRTRFTRRITSFHRFTPFGDRTPDKARQYAEACGAFCRKQDLPGIALLRSAAHVAMLPAFGVAEGRRGMAYAWSVARGTISGWRRYSP